MHTFQTAKLLLSPAGYLVSVDAYMNLQVGRMSLSQESVQRFALSTACDIVVLVQLASTEEYIDGQFTGNLGEVLIRYQEAQNTTLSTACCLGSCCLSTSSCY